jgi:hypothetical protein
MSNFTNKLEQFAVSLERPLEEVTRQYLLEAILRRLINTSLKDFFVLRGGMLMRIWVSPKLRPAEDLDFLGLFPYDLPKTLEKISHIISQKPTLDDGVEFFPSSVEGEATWVGCPSPGMRIFMKGIFEGNFFSSKIDVGFNDPLVPSAINIDFPTFILEPIKNVLSCRVETALGWKLHGLIEFGEKRWRAKDLYDIYLLLDSIDPNNKDLSDAIKVAFSSRGESLLEAVKMFESPTWWTREKSQVRWQKFQETKGLVIKPSLIEIAENVKKVLLPIVINLRKEA